MKRTHALLLTAIVTSTQLLTSAPLPDADWYYIQNFDHLKTTASAWENNTTIPGWYLYRQGTPPTAVTSLSAGAGTGTAGGFYSFGSAASSDRALGGLASATYSGWIAASFENASTVPFDSLAVGWAGEQWRNAGNPTAQTMLFEYGFGSSFSAVTEWIAPGGNFDWSSPVHTATAGAVNGNVAGRVENVGGELLGLNWRPGDTLWLRWIERDDLGPDHGLAIDDFWIVPFCTVWPPAEPETPASVPDQLPAGYPAVTFAGLILLAAGLKPKQLA